MRLLKSALLGTALSAVIASTAGAHERKIKIESYLYPQYTIKKVLLVVVQDHTFPWHRDLNIPGSLPQGPHHSQVVTMPFEFPCYRWMKFYFTGRGPAIMKIDVCRTRTIEVGHINPTAGPNGPLKFMVETELE